MKKNKNFIFFIILLIIILVILIIFILKKSERYEQVIKYEEPISLIK